MRFAALNPLPSSRETVSVFGGFNARTRIAPGEFSQM